MIGASPAVRLRGLAATAMIGLDRSVGEARSPERLLSHAAVLGAQARAGYRARRCSGQVSECAAESKSVAGAAAMATMIRLLSDPEAALIEEWAECARARGQRVAEHTVPLLLEWWCRQPQRKDVIFAVCGKRAEWLASLNPAWRKPVAGEEVPAKADEIWQTGSTPERIALLMTIRRHDPARALSMVQSTWADDGADERRRFLGVLLEGRSMADEPFLEVALGDKSKQVREQAALVLGLVPGSRLRGRMTELARAMMKVERKGLLKRGVRVQLEPPIAFDKAWERDGITEQVAAGKGKRAWWMRQILQHAELSLWTELSGLEPAGVIEALSGDDYAADAMSALVVAASTVADRSWCFALADALTAGDRPHWLEFSGLWHALTRADRETLVLRVANRLKGALDDRWALIATCKGPWSREFSMSAMELLARNASREGGDVPHPWQAIESISFAIDPSAADKFEAAIRAMTSKDPTPSVRKSIDRVRLRADMHREFAA